MPQVPRVSMTTGTNSCATASDAYFAALFTSATAAAAPAPAAERCRCEGARVSGHVASHRRHRPRDQGTRVTPSGRLASDRLRPGGSRMDGTPALCSARQMVSFTKLCRRCLPALRRQASPCWPKLSTDKCGRNTGVPTLAAPPA